MHKLISTAMAFGLLLAVAGPVAAHQPTSGAVREYPAGTSLIYRFAGTYPSWMQSAAQVALGTDWKSPTFNNSRLPSFTYSPTGSGIIYYSSSASSPCGTGNTEWLQCASNWGSSAWRIYVRNLSGAPFRSWTWCDISFSGTCWDLERALLHEAEHVTLAIGNHDPQGESNTIMGAGAPWYPNTGWNTHHLQRCDEAAAQLEYGMAQPSGPVADCFDHVAGHGVAGLIPDLSSTTSSVSVCLSQVATLSGRLAVGTSSNYHSMSGATLGGRTIGFDRKPHTSSAWTLGVTTAVSTDSVGTNWTRGFSTSSTSPITYDFRPHTSGEAGLDGTTGPVISVTWRSC